MIPEFNTEINGSGFIFANTQAEIDYCKAELKSMGYELLNFNQRQDDFDGVYTCTYRVKRRLNIILPALPGLTAKVN